MPKAISVYMLRLRDTSEFQPRAKNGHAAQSTTGIEKRSWIHPESFASGNAPCRPGACSAIAKPNTGTVSASPIQNRRVISASSGFGPPSALATTGSRAMPHFGQTPGPTCRISGCIGQV